jgi:hypoxanthine phosphoribosyltransferase
MQTMITVDEIANRVREMAAEIRRDHPESLHLVSVLNGSFVFASDLMRAIPGIVTLDFIAVSSYGSGISTSGEVQLQKDLDNSIEGRCVVIVEDIADSGLTLSYLQTLLRARAPKTLKTACLLSKPSRRTVPVQMDYVGFEIEDRFVVGYGLDHNGLHRNLPYIGVIE